MSHKRTMKFQQAVYNIGYPAYGARFLNDNVLLVAGGGGEGNNGIPNKLTALQVSFDKRKVIKRFRELTLNENDDSPTTLDAANNIILMGCNENSEKIKATGENLHLRKYVFENEHLKFVASIDMDHSSKFEDYTKLTYMSQDGSVAAIASSKVPTVIRIMNPNLLTETYEIETGNDVKDLHFSPDGKVLSYITSSTLEVISIVTGRFIVRKTDFDKSWALSKIKFIGEDTVLIAAALKKGTGIVLSKVNLKSGTTSVLKTRLVTTKLRGVTSMDVDPTGQLAAISGNDNSIVLVRLKNLTVAKFFKQVHSFAITKVAFSPNGKILASVSAANTIHVILVPDKLATSVPILERIVKLFINFVLIVVVAAAVQISYKYDLHTKAYRYGVAKWNARRDSFIMNDVFRQTTLVGDVVSIETLTNFAPTESSSVNTPTYETTVPELSTTSSYSSSWSSPVPEDPLLTSDASTVEEPEYFPSSLEEISAENESANSEASASMTVSASMTASISGVQESAVSASEEKPTQATQKSSSESEALLSDSNDISTENGLNKSKAQQQFYEVDETLEQQPTPTSVQSSDVHSGISLTAENSKGEEASPSHKISSASSGASSNVSLGEPVSKLPSASRASPMDTPIEESSPEMRVAVSEESSKSASTAPELTPKIARDVSNEKPVEKSANAIPEASTQALSPALAEAPVKTHSSFSNQEATSLTTTPAFSATGRVASADSPKKANSEFGELQDTERERDFDLEASAGASDAISSEEPVTENRTYDASSPSSFISDTTNTQIASSPIANSVSSTIANSSLSSESKKAKEINTSSPSRSQEPARSEIITTTASTAVEDKSAAPTTSSQAISQDESDGSKAKTESNVIPTQASATGIVSPVQLMASTESSNLNKVPKSSNSAQSETELAEAKVHLSTPEELQSTEKTDEIKTSSPHISSWGKNPSSNTNAPTNSIALPDDFENRFTPEDETYSEEKRSPIEDEELEADAQIYSEQVYPSQIEVADPLPQSTPEPSVSREPKDTESYSEPVSSQSGDSTAGSSCVSASDSVEETSATSMQTEVTHDEF